MPVGGGPTIGGEPAAALVRELAPRLVVPMHYATPAVNFLEPPDAFLDALGAEVARLDSPEAELEPLLGTADSRASRSSQRPERASHRRHEHGGPEVLELQDLPDPAPGRGRAAGRRRGGRRQLPRRLRARGRRHGSEPPHLAGVEGAGTVGAVGEGVDGFAAGDRVAWSNAPGSYAERVLVAADAAVPVPDGVSTELAAAALLQGMTAHYLATDTYPMQPGDDGARARRGGRRRAAAHPDREAARRRA